MEMGVAGVARRRVCGGKTIIGVRLRGGHRDFAYFLSAVVM
jgi:hypothetical protein